MRSTARLFAAAVMTGLFATVPASASRMTDFDLNKLDSWSDAIAVCDVTRFLLIDPDVNADAILVAGRDNTRTALYRPLFTPPDNFFSEAMHQTFERVKKAGLASDESYGRARLHYAAQMIGAYNSASMTDKRFMADQMELCYHLAVRAGVKLTPVLRGKP
jgi:hypothetical protein